MKLLIVEDNPNEKLGNIIDLLANNSIEYSIVRSKQSADEYFKNSWKELDGIILDLGLPENSNGDHYDAYAGIKLLENWSYKLSIRKIPVIINSSAEIPLEIKNKLPDNIIGYQDNLSICNDYQLNSILKALRTERPFSSSSFFPQVPKVPKEWGGRTFYNGHYTHDGD